MAVASPSTPVKVDDALTLPLQVTAGATLPAVVQAALRVSAKLGCRVQFTWDGLEITLGTSDTFQGVQRRVQKLRKAEA